jgi:acyl-CoA synthetase (AMP-forming)/AMP-acid ligase II
MIFSSPYPEIDIPDQVLPDFILENAARFGSRPALIDGISGRSVGYDQLSDRIHYSSEVLRKAGFQAGDVLALYLPNSPEYVFVFLAAHQLGGVVTPLNHLLKANELEVVLRHSGARMIVTTEELSSTCRELQAGAILDQILIIDTFENSGTRAADQPLPEVLARNPGVDLAALPYSSGTTGLPKGVMLTHRNLVANISQVRALDHFNEQDTLIGILPFSHIYGMVFTLLHGLRAGAAIVTLSKFDPTTFLKAIQDHKITIAHLVPPLVQFLAKHPMIDDYDLSSLRLIISGAASLGEALARECAERLECLVGQGYGLTETSPVTHCNPADAARIKHGSIGPTISGTECKILDPQNGKALGSNQTGELYVRGPQVMLGYINEAEATREMIDSKGWLATGDLAYADEEGYFYIVGRLKEMIKYKGHQVSPAELEAILMRHPAVTDAAVVRGYDENSEEIPKAFIVRGSDGSAEEIIEFAASRSASYKRIRSLEFIEEIPRSAAGKILRRELTDKA